MSNLSQKGQAWYESVLNIRISGRFILKAKKSWQDIVIENLVVCGGQGCQIGFVHDVSEHHYCNLYSLGLNSRVWIVKMLKNVWKNELKSHIYWRFNRNLIEHLEPTTFRLRIKATWQKASYPMNNHQYRFFVFQTCFIISRYWILKSLKILLRKENKEFIAWNKEAAILINCVFF